MNYKIIIDAGHGGADPGAVSNDILEKEYTLKISEYMARRFTELGIENNMTRTTDETLEPIARVQRARNFFGNTSNIILLSNHLNAGGGDGFEIIYALRNDDILPSLISEEIEKEGQNLRNNYQKTLPNDPSKDFFFILRDTAEMHSLLIEYGFIDSPSDDVSQIKNNWQNFAEAVVRGVLRYIGFNNVNQQKTYIVQKGESLWSIAKKYGIAVDQIKKSNNLLSNNITVGQELIIPL